MNEASVSSLSNADFETPVTAETPTAELQPIETAYEKPDPAFDQTSEFDQTEASADSSDLDSISSSNTPTIDVTASIPDAQLESDSLNPLTVSDESVTDSMEAEPVKPLDIEEKDEIDREAQENESGQAGADGEQPLEAEPIEDSIDTALSALNLPAETEHIKEKATSLPNIQSETIQPPVLPDGGETGTDDSSQIKSTEDRIPAEGTDPEEISSPSDIGEDSESPQDKEESYPQP